MSWNLSLVIRHWSLLGLLLFCFCAKAQQESSYEDFKNLKGKVRSVQENYYTSLEHYRNRTYEKLYKTLEVVRRCLTFDELGRAWIFEEYDTPKHCLKKKVFLYDSLSRPIGYDELYDTGELNYRKRDLSLDHKSRRQHREV